MVIFDHFWHLNWLCSIIYEYFWVVFGSFDDFLEFLEVEVTGYDRVEFWSWKITWRLEINRGLKWLEMTKHRLELNHRFFKYKSPQNDCNITNLSATLGQIWMKHRYQSGISKILQLFINDLEGSPGYIDVGGECWSHCHQQDCSRVSVMQYSM